VAFQGYALEITELKLSREYRAVLSLLLGDGCSFKFFHSVLSVHSEKWTLITFISSHEP